ncbi:MAG TPA: hypothetical protein VEJ84_14325 [Acidimicrobiales bacterium]|nr:hypothetical protein [Acidimicrobiales bacterium]
MTATAHLARIVVVRGDGTRDVTLLVGDHPPDLSVVGALARLQLTCLRAGCHIYLEDVDVRLDELLDLTGLGREVGWQPEGGEELVGLEEGVDPGNAVS